MPLFLWDIAVKALKAPNALLFRCLTGIVIFLNIVVKMVVGLVPALHAYALAIIIPFLVISAGAIITAYLKTHKDKQTKKMTPTKTPTGRNHIANKIADAKQANQLKRARTGKHVSEKTGATTKTDHHQPLTKQQPTDGAKHSVIAA